MCVLMGRCLCVCLWRVEESVKGSTVSLYSFEAGSPLEPGAMSVASHPVSTSKVVILSLPPRAPSLQAPFLASVFSERSSLLCVAALRGPQRALDESFNQHCQSGCYPTKAVSFSPGACADSCGWIRPQSFPHANLYGQTQQPLEKREGMLSLKGRDRTRGLWNGQCQGDNPFCLSFDALPFYFRDGFRVREVSSRCNSTYGLRFSAVVSVLSPCIR